MTLRFAFNTNGAANHRLDDALTLIAEAGYDGVALTLDIHHLDPYDPDFLLNTRHVAARLAGAEPGLRGGNRRPLPAQPARQARADLAEPRTQKAGRKRVDFLTRALTVVAETGGEAMSFWAGVPKRGVTHGASTILAAAGCGGDRSPG